MENGQNIGYLIFVSSSILLVIAIAFLLFAINQRKKRKALESIIAVSKSRNNKDIQQLKDDSLIVLSEIKRLEKRVEQLEKEIRQRNSN